MLFSYGNIYLLYIYFCKSHKVWPAQLVRKENTCRKDQVPLFPATWVRFVPVAVGCWLKKEKKKDAFKNDHVQERSLFLFHSPFFPGSLCPAFLLLYFTCLSAESWGFLRASQDSWGLLTPK